MKKIILILTVISVIGFIYISSQKSEEIKPQVVDGGGDKIKQLEISEILEGQGISVQIGNLVSIHYSSSLLNGQVMDSSYDQNKPVEFRVGEGKTLRCFEQGVLGMKVGGKRKLTSPPDMAYGTYGTGKTIPPNAAIIFQIELLKIE